MLVLLSAPLRPSAKETDRQFFTPIMIFPWVSPNHAPLLYELFIRLSLPAEKLSDRVLHELARALHTFLNYKLSIKQLRDN
jgi:hypothetical protein